MKHFSLLCLWGVLMLGGLSAQTDSADSPLPDVFGYYSHDQRLIKLDLFHLFKVYDAGELSGMLSLGYEQKFKRKWSWQAELSSWYVFNTSIPRMSWKNQVSGLTIGLRYYHAQHKAFTYGRSAINLVGAYWGLNAATRFVPKKASGASTRDLPHLFSDSIGFIPHYGWQTKLGKYCFVDFSLGIKLSYGDPVRRNAPIPLHEERVWQLRPVSHLRLGLAL